MKSVFKMALSVMGFSVVFSGSSFAQDWIIKVKPGTESRLKKIAPVESLFPALNLFLVKDSGRRELQNNISAFMRTSPDVIYSQANHRVELRQLPLPVPNDLEFKRQWYLDQANRTAHIHALEAWKMGTGGVTPLGEEIVVAVVDVGIQSSHPDLAGNLWINAGEIPENKIDDDQNGYIDDVNGWNAIQQNGVIRAAEHSTHIAGIIGARGNNKLQIAGLNHQIKIMNVAGASSDTAAVIRAYSYVYQQKKTFLESKGKRGANVVATNSSFGLNASRCDSEQFKAWNEVYDVLGSVGILSVVATMNKSSNIDQVGDVPSGCASNFIISVTNTGSDDSLSPVAAYGAQSIDLGAPGTNIYSLNAQSGVTSLSGTSMATPMVTGAVAFAHSVASRSFSSLNSTNPGQAALALKGIILGETDPVPSLKNKTVSGGRLNLAKVATAISHFQAR